MRKMKTITEPAKTREVLDYVECELCDARSGSDDWSPGLYEVTEPNVYLRKGTNYPEGSSIDTTHLDICPRCFKEKLIPWFVSQGGSTREESDW